MIWRSMLQEKAKNNDKFLKDEVKSSIYIFKTIEQ